MHVKKYPFRKTTPLKIFRLCVSRLLWNSSNIKVSIDFTFYINWSLYFDKKWCITNVIIIDFYSCTYWIRNYFNSIFCFMGNNVIPKRTKSKTT